jgi:DNA-dependent RNA polymerase auxiliary subunit epsilon
MALDNRKYHFIYKTTNLKNDNFYIGLHSTNNLDDGYIGSGDKLRSSVRHYGKENHKFEILEFYSNRDLIMQREKEIVNADLLKNPLCMNIMQGGYGFTDLDHFKKVCEAGNKVFREKLKDESYREEFIEKTRPSREKALLKYNELYKSGDLIPNYFRGKKHSEESISKMKSSDRTGIKNSQFGTVWISHPDLGIKKIKKEDMFDFESNGWKRGRKNNF